MRNFRPRDEGTFGKVEGKRSWPTTRKFSRRSTRVVRNRNGRAFVPRSATFVLKVLARHALVPHRSVHALASVFPTGISAFGGLRARRTRAGPVRIPFAQRLSGDNSLGARTDDDASIFLSFFLFFFWQSVSAERRVLSDDESS